MQPVTTILSTINPNFHRVFCGDIPLRQGDIKEPKLKFYKTVFPTAILGNKMPSREPLLLLHN